MATNNKTKTVGSKPTKKEEKIVTVEKESNDAATVSTSESPVSVSPSFSADDLKTIISGAVGEVVNTNKKKSDKSFDEDDAIVCRSVTRGLLILIGRKTGNKYVWSDFDDTCEVEVQDLNSLRAVKSDYLYKPLFMIDDDEFLTQDKWKELKESYDQIMLKDVQEIMELDNDSFKRVLISLPKGYQEAVKAEVATRIDNETMDSIQKVKIVDEICGTDLTCLL